MFRALLPSLVQSDGIPDLSSLASAGGMGGGGAEAAAAQEAKKQYVYRNFFEAPHLPLVTVAVGIALVDRRRAACARVDTEKWRRRASPCCPKS